MNYSSKQNAFISQIIVWSLMLVGIAGSFGVGVVWQRQLIAQTANRIKVLETSLAEIERRQTELNSQLATAQSLDALTHLNTHFGLGLVAIREQQLVRVNTSPEQRLAAKRNAELFAETRPAPVPATTTNTLFVSR